MSLITLAGPPGVSTAGLVCAAATRALSSAIPNIAECLNLRRPFEKVLPSEDIKRFSIGMVVSALSRLTRGISARARCSPRLHKKAAGKNGGRPFWCRVAAKVVSEAGLLTRRECSLRTDLAPAIQSSTSYLFQPFIGYANFAVARSSGQTETYCLPCSWIR